jgi:hypothetical protein
VTKTNQPPATSNFLFYEPGMHTKLHSKANALTSTARKKQAPATAYTLITATNLPTSPITKQKQTKRIKDEIFLGKVE